jgi:hypothetical protein
VEQRPNTIAFVRPRYIATPRAIAPPRLQVIPVPLREEPHRHHGGDVPARSGTIERTRTAGPCRPPPPSRVRQPALPIRPRIAARGAIRPRSRSRDTIACNVPTWPGEEPNVGAEASPTPALSECAIIDGDTAVCLLARRADTKRLTGSGNAPIAARFWSRHQLAQEAWKRLRSRCRSRARHLYELRASRD